MKNLKITIIVSLSMYLTCSKPFQLDAQFGGVVVNPNGVISTSENGDAAVFTVALTRAPTSTVSIPLESSDTNRGTVSIPTITFTSENWARARTVVVTGVDDGTMADGSHEYAINLGPIQSDDGNYHGQRPQKVRVINVDNDIPGIYVTPISGLNTSESGGTGTFKIKLTVEPTANVRVTLQSGNLSEGRIRQTSGACSPSGSVLTTTPCYVDFSPANWNVEQDIVVQGVNDALTDGNVSYAVNSVSVVSVDPRYNTVVMPTVTLTNTDDDVPAVSVSVTSGNLPEAGTLEFDVVLTTAPSVALDINLFSSNTAEGQIRQSAGNCLSSGAKATSACKLTFTPANWLTPQTVTIEGVDDGDADGNVGFNVALEPIVSTDPDYAGINPPDVSVTSIDNGLPGFVISPTSGLVTTEAGGTAQFSIRLQSQPTSPVTVAITSGTATEGTASPGTLTFLTTNWDSARTITVTGVADNRLDGNVAYNIRRQITAGTGFYAIESSPVNIVSVTNNNADTGKLVFVTTGTRNGGAGLGSLDTLCNTDSAKPNTSTYRAIAGAEANDDATALRDYLANWILYPNQKYYRAVDGRLVGQTDASGRFSFNLTNSFHNASVTYWTGLSALFFADGTSSCKNFGQNSWSHSLSTGPKGTVGDGSVTNSGAIISGAPVSCNQQRSALCAEQ